MWRRWRRCFSAILWKFWKSMRDSRDAVFLERFLVDPHSKTGTGGHRHIAIGHLQRRLDHGAAQGALRGVEFHEYGTSLKRVQVKGRGGEQVRRPRVRDDQNVRQFSHVNDFSGNGE